MKIEINIQEDLEEEDIFKHYGYYNTIYDAIAALLDIEEKQGEQQNEV